ncbi:hypothetical protein ACTFQF_00140 [Aliivibrio fischeri]|uniref:hypothetical protein n=1 Tax=Aliivibrio fischeri TaxID=668 RepID=UPI003F765663
MNEHKKPTIETLRKVLQGSRDDLNIPSHIDPSATVRLPYLGNKGRYTEYFAMSYEQLGKRINQLKVPPQIPMLKNIANAAMRYSATAMLPVNHPFHAEIRRLHTSLISVGQSDKTKTQKNSEKNRIYAKINKAYSNRFSKSNPESEYKKTKELAEKLINDAVNELENTDQLGVYSRSDALKFANGFISIFESQMILKSTSDMEKLLIQEFQYSEDSQSAFLKKKFSTDNPKDYLMMLLEQNVSVFESAAKEANINADEMLQLIELAENNTSSENLATSVAKKAALNPKKSVRGAFNAYIKNDHINGRFKNVLLNIHIWKGGKKEIVPFYFYPAFENANDPHSRNEYIDFIKEGDVPNVIFNEKSAQEFNQREKERSEKRQQILRTIEAENAEKLANSKATYQKQTPVTSSVQLKNSYWSQKGLIEEAAQYLTGLRIDKDGTTWLPLDSTLTEDRDISTTTGYQKIYSQKIEIPREGEESEFLNKMFDGLGDGKKKEAFYTIGNPYQASVILTNEGIANGLHAYVKAKERGLNSLVICAIDAGNINHAIRAAIKKYPTLPIVNIADNDKFNKHGQERFAPAITYTDLATKEVVRLENTGIKVANDFNDAIELPSVHVDFANINGKDFTNEQKNNKLSDIDDLVHTLNDFYKNEGLSHEDALNKASKEAGDYLVNAITTKLQQNISPNWSIENQYKYKWVPTDINLNKEQFQNFYDIKDSLLSAYDFFKKSNDQGLDYQTYSQVIRTGREINLTFNDANKSTKEIINESPVAIEKPILIQEIPVVELHGQTPLTQLYENKEVLQEKIYDLEQRIDNLSLSSSDMAQVKISNYELQLHSLTQELKNLQQQITKLEPVEHTTTSSIDKPEIKQKPDDFSNSMANAFSVPKYLYDLEAKLEHFHKISSTLHDELWALTTSTELNGILLDLNQIKENQTETPTLHELQLQNIKLANDLISSYLTVSEEQKDIIKSDVNLVINALDSELKAISQPEQSDTPTDSAVNTETQPESAQTENIHEDVVAPEQPDTTTDSPVNVETAPESAQSENVLEDVAAPEQPDTPTDSAVNTETQPESAQTENIQEDVVAPEQPDTTTDSPVNVETAPESAQSENVLEDVAAPEQPDTPTDSAVNTETQPESAQTENIQGDVVAPEQPDTTTDSPVNVETAPESAQSENVLEDVAAPEQPDTPTDSAVNTETQPESAQTENIQEDVVAPEQPDTTTDSAVNVETAPESAKSDNVQEDVVVPEQSGKSNNKLKAFKIHRDWNFTSTKPDAFDVSINTAHYQKHEIDTIKNLQNDIAELKNKLNVIRSLNPTTQSKKELDTVKNNLVSAIPPKRSALELNQIFNSKASRQVNLKEETTTTLTNKEQSIEQPVERLLSELISELNNALEKEYKTDEIHNIKFKQISSELKDNIKSVIEKSFSEHNLTTLTDQKTLIESINTIARQSSLNRGILISATMSHAMSISSPDTSAYAIRNVVFDSLSYSEHGPLSNASIEHINGNMSLEEYVSLAEKALPEKEFKSAFANDIEQLTTTPQHENKQTISTLEQEIDESSLAVN